MAPEWVSEQEFYWYFDSQFRVLSDGSTILGVPLKKAKTVLKQNTVGSRRELVFFGQGERDIKSLAVSEEKNTLLAGEYSGHLGRAVQYDLTTAQMLRFFSLEGLRSIYSINVRGNFFFLGSGGRGYLAILDIASRTEACPPLETTYNMIDSLQLCAVERSPGEVSVLLTITGREANYQSEATDLFDVTALFAAKPANKT